MDCGTLNLVRAGLLSICRSGTGIWAVCPQLSFVVFLSYAGVATVNGDPLFDRIQLNLDSLWTGGPFADTVSSFRGLDG